MMKRIFLRLSCFWITRHIFVVVILLQHSHSNVLHMSHMSDNSFTSEPCQEKADNYCDSRVENSICHTLKDECYCRKGHVFIKDVDRDTCKTLLTDLRCGLQGQCIHVNGSICHPGVGFCVCPKGTIYVPQLHECRNRALPGNNAYCSACREKGGTCYYKAEHEIQSTKKQESDRYGCKCPKNHATLKKFEMVPAKICEAKLVDINEYCNDVNFLCRSHKARCTAPDKLSSATVCTCPPKHVPVFQGTLRYYECFPELTGDKRGCEGCTNNNGRCFDNNGDNQGDGCVCSAERSSGSSVSTVYQEPGQPGSMPCQSVHVYATCRKGSMKVCYLPHDDPPYENLRNRLLLSKAVAYLSGGSRTTTECRLKPLEARARVRFCVTIGLQTHVAENCGIRSYKMKNGKWLYLYEGSLVIQVDNDFRTPSQDKIVHLSCYSNEPIPKQVAKPTPTTPILQTHHKQRHSGNKNVFSQVYVDLRILNINDREIISTMAGEPIKMDMILRDDKDRFRAIKVEDCYASNTSFSPLGSPEKKPKPLLIVEKGCPVAKAGFTASFHPTKLGFTHYQSRLFPAFRLGKSSSLFLKCLLRICKDRKWCVQNHCPGGGHTKRDLPEVRVVTRLAYLNVTGKIVDQRPSHQQLPGYTVPRLPLRDCDYSACLTTPQIVIISLVLFLLFVLVCCLIFVIYRKRQITTRLSRNPGHMTNCMLDDDEGTPLDDKCPVGSSTCGGSGSGSGSGGGTLPSNLLVAHTGTLDTLQTYSSHFTMDRDRSPMEQSCNSSALLSNSRPDVCTCDHTSDQRKSMTTSQV